MHGVLAHFAGEDERRQTVPGVRVHGHAELVRATCRRAGRSVSAAVAGGSAVRGRLAGDRAKLGRIALSAGSRAIISMTLARTARLALSGAACGLGLALMLGALLKTALYLAPGQHAGVLYGVGIQDPVSLAAAATVMLGLAGLAALAPAARAARVDPSAVLRQET